MGGGARSQKQEREQLVRSLRGSGSSWVEVAEALRGRYRVNARVAFRYAHGWSQRRAADEWNKRWPDELKTFKNFSYWESWPGPTGHAPTFDNLSKLAELYECAASDLLVDLPNFRHLDTVDSTNPDVDKKRLVLPGERTLDAGTGGSTKEDRHAGEARADTSSAPSQNGNGLVLPTGQEVLGSLVSAGGAELAGGLAGPLLYLAFLSTPAQAAPIEWREQLREQLRTFLREWANTMDRREHLRLLGWVATAVAASHITSLDTDEQERLSKVIFAPSRVDAQAIDHIETMLRHCKRQEDALGSRMVLETVLAQRHLIHDLLDECPAEVRPRLLSVYSDMSTSIGYYFFELNDLGSARYYCEQARVAAHEAGNADLGIYALCELSYFASWQGKAPVSIDLAAAAESLLSKTDDPLMRVAVAQRAATAYAAAGEYKACMVELERAQDSLRSAGQVSVESPLYFYNEGYLISHRSECLLRLGKPQEAAVSASAGLILYDTSFVDGYAVCMLHLGNAHLQADEIDEAARVIGEGALLAAKTRSARLTSEITAARCRLQPWHKTTAVKELDERLRVWGFGR